jgi:hypothetical protein
MAKDWKSIAAAIAPDIPAESVARITPQLEALEAAFRPLLERIPADGEPSYVQLTGREREVGA